MWHGPYYALSHKMISQSDIYGAQRKCLLSSDLMPGSCLTTPIPLSQRKEGKRHGIGSHACFQQLPLSQDGPPTAAVPACPVVYRERTEKHIEVVTKTAQQTQAVKILEGHLETIQGKYNYNASATYTSSCVMYQIKQFVVDFSRGFDGFERKLRYALSEEQQHTLRLTQRTSAQTRTQRHCGSQPWPMHLSRSGSSQRGQWIGSCECEQWN